MYTPPGQDWILTFASAPQPAQEQAHALLQLSAAGAVAELE